MENEQIKKLLQDVFPMEYMIAGDSAINQLIDTKRKGNDEGIIISTDGGDDFDFSGTLEILSTLISIVLVVVQIRKETVNRNQVKNRLNDYLKKKNREIEEEKIEAILDQLLNNDQ